LAPLVPDTAGAIGAFSILCEWHCGHTNSPAAARVSNAAPEENQSSNSWLFSHLKLKTITL
jgi:hypothetical protein